MTRWMTMTCGVLLVLACTACGSSKSSTATSSSSPRDDADLQSGAHALEETQETWFAAGSGGMGSLVDPQGRPKEPAGRYVNQGRGLAEASLGAKGWLVASRDGALNRIDAEGRSLRIAETEDFLELTGKIQFVQNGDNGWLIGGTNGWVQRVDELGQLVRGGANHVFERAGGSKPDDGVTAVDAAYRNGRWLIGDAQGRLVRLDASDITKAGQQFVINGQPRIEAVAATSQKWYVFTASGYLEFQSGGNVDETTSLGNNLEITEATAENGTLAIGTKDGRVALVQPSDLPNLTWTDALEGAEIRELVSSSAPEVDTSYDEWLAVGAQGRARRLDSKGQTVGSIETPGRDGTTLRAARPLEKGWMIGLSSLSAVRRLERDLTPIGQTSDRFGGATIRATAAGGGVLLAVGDGGRYRLFHPDGSTATDLERSDQSSRWISAAWNGDYFLVGGKDGRVARIETDGRLSDVQRPIGDEAIAALSWSGTFWAVIGETCTLQRLQSNANPFGEAESCPLTDVNGVSFAGSTSGALLSNKWFVVGAQNGQAAVATIIEETSEEGSSGERSKTISGFQGPFYAVATSGAEWLVGGEQGQIMRISQQLRVIDQGVRIRDALYGQTVRAIRYSGDKYLVGGDRGTVRRLEFNGRPTGAPAAVNGFEDVYAIAWTPPVGFPAGPCVQELCYVGSCLEDPGICCESSCTSPCRSCLHEETGEPDGVCAPVPAGEEPPDRKRRDCKERPKSSCGQTGVCDGDGSCRYWSTDDNGEPIQCQPATCSNGMQTGAGTCASADNDTCQTPDPVSCEPYKGCASNGTDCKTSCSGPEDCITGYICEEGSCIEEPSSPDAGMGGPDAGSGSGSGGSMSGGGGGCSMSPSAPAPSMGAWLLLGLLALRRSRRLGIHRA